jgi:pyrimidine operon attenuation protein/uracil phosphoribosyltransferase
MPTLQNPILSATQVLQKVRRIAYEIYENNFEEQELVFASIAPNGVLLGELLATELQTIATSLQIIPITITCYITKSPDNQTAIETTLSCEKSILQTKTIIVIDDVLHTGKTLIYSLKPLLEIPVKKIQTVVLVKREHHQFPIHADYVGYALSTTIRQHVHVELKDQTQRGVYLF